MIYEIDAPVVQVFSSEHVQDIAHLIKSVETQINTTKAVSVLKLIEDEVLRQRRYNSELLVELIGTTENWSLNYMRHPFANMRPAYSIHGHTYIQGVEARGVDICLLDEAQTTITADDLINFRDSRISAFPELFRDLREEYIDHHVVVENPHDNTIIDVGHWNPAGDYVVNHSALGKLLGFKD